MTWRFAPQSDSGPKFILAHMPNHEVSIGLQCCAPISFSVTTLHEANNRRDFGDARTVHSPSTGLGAQPAAMLGPGEQNG